jgi:hypothetical protein
VRVSSLLQGNSYFPDTKPEKQNLPSGCVRQVAIRRCSALLGSVKTSTSTLARGSWCMKVTLFPAEFCARVSQRKFLFGFLPSGWSPHSWQDCKSNHWKCFEQIVLSEGREIARSRRYSKREDFSSRSVPPHNAIRHAKNRGGLRGPNQTVNNVANRDVRRMRYR